MHYQKLTYRLDGEKGNDMETIYKVVQKKDHSFIYAIFDIELEATDYANYKNKWANCDLTEAIAEEINPDIYEDLFYPTVEQGEGIKQ